MLYHYTDNETFIKIIENKEIWLSNIFQTNDPYDGLWIIEVIKENYPEIYDKYIYKKMDRYKNIEYISSGQGSKYIACFSKKRDLLSQWRGYGDDGKGICIGFNENILERYVDDISHTLQGYLRLLPIEYKKEKQLEDIKRTYENREIYDNVNPGNDDIRWCTELIDYSAALYKQNGFREEQEIRLIYKPEQFISELQCEDKIRKCGTIYIPQIYYRTNKQKDDIIPYYKLDISGSYDIIKEIIVGPKSKLHNKIILGLLHGNGFKISEESIKLSEISYK
jgi:hypothetical protein